MKLTARIQTIKNHSTSKFITEEKAWFETIMPTYLVGYESKNHVEGCFELFVCRYLALVIK
jgi:hypothetical protein